MKILNVLSSEKLKHRFAKDTRIPLSVFVSPYFESRLNLYNSTLFPELLDKWNSYLSMLEHFDNEQQYFELYSHVKDTCIDFIKSSSGFIHFNEEDMSKFSANTCTCFPSKDIFKPIFNEKKFLSFDMVKANFSVLKHYNKSIFNNCDTWEDFIGQYTDYRHIIDSKYIREVILGNCNPKRNITYERYIMSNIVEDFLSTIETDMQRRVVFFSNDEVIFDVSDLEKKDIFFIENTMRNANVRVAKDIELRSSYFKLFHIPEIDGYLEFDLRSKEITSKKVDGFLMPFLCCKLLNQEPTFNETVFIHSNHSLLANFIDIPVFDLPYEIKEAWGKE